MLTGLELSGIVLAVFPILISGLEHYEEGFRSIKEWIRFRAEYASFINALSRQKIFFRQSLEDLLTTVVESEFEMARMLDDPKDEGWEDPELESKLKARLSGKHEYECYMDTVSSIRDVLQELGRQLRIKAGQVGCPWTR